MNDDPALFPVHLIGFPLVEQAAAAEHFDGLMREFAFLRAGDATGSGVPARLIALRGELVDQVQTFTDVAAANREAAVSRGETAMDLTMRLPAAARDATRQLADLLDEADDFCRT